MSYNKKLWEITNEIAGVFDEQINLDLFLFICLTQKETMFKVQ